MSDTDKHLHNQLIKLGDMLGDGDCEPWVAQEYRRVAKALGYAMPAKKRDSQAINRRVNKALKSFTCKCGCKPKQTRSGSLNLVCECGAKFKLKTRRVKV